MKSISGLYKIDTLKIVIHHEEFPLEMKGRNEYRDTTFSKNKWLWNKSWRIPYWQLIARPANFSAYDS